MQKSQGRPGVAVASVTLEARVLYSESLSADAARRWHMMWPPCEVEALGLFAVGLEHVNCKRLWGPQGHIEVRLSQQPTPPESDHGPAPLK